MVKKKISHKFLGRPALALLLSCLFAAFAAFSPVCSADASEPDARSTELKTGIEGLNVKQLGGNQLVLELRGTKVTRPAVVKDATAAIRFEWSNIRFPRDTDKQDWWDGYEWDIIKLSKAKKDKWWERYDCALARRIEVTSNDQQGLTMRIFGDQPLEVKEISGMDGSDLIKVTLQTHSNIPQAPKRTKQALAAGDPLGMYSPVTLELRDVSIRDAFRMLAELRHLNLVLDPSVPEQNVTFSFKNAKFNEVFAYLLRMNDLSYAMMGKTLVVGTNESIGKTLGTNVQKEYKVAYGDVKKLPAMIMSMVTLPKPPVVDDRTRSLYITGTPDQHREVENLINRLDHPGKQVMLEARLVEVNDNASQELEVLLNSVYKGWIMSYSGSNGLSTEYTDYNGASNVTPDTDSDQGQLPILGKLTDNSYNPINVVDKTLHLFDGGFRALEAQSKGRVLANPSLVTLDGQKSTIKLTHNYLYQSGVDDNGNPEYSNQEAGPVLDLTPTVGRDGFITIKMRITNGDIVAWRTSGTSEAPETTNREVDTTIRVRNSEPFVIGGLYAEENSKERKRVPILSSIPLIGNLFRYKTDKHTKSQMAFIVVPYILDVPTGPAEIYKMPSAGITK